jgi:hypothetical protein
MLVGSGGPIHGFKPISGQSRDGKVCVFAKNVSIFLIRKNVSCKSVPFLSTAGLSGKWGIRNYCVLKFNTKTWI